MTRTIVFDRDWPFQAICSRGDCTGFIFSQDAEGYTKFLKEKKGVRAEIFYVRDILDGVCDDRLRALIVKTDEEKSREIYQL